MRPRTSIRPRKRKRRGYVRPSRAKPKSGFTLRQLAGLVGFTPRLVRLYLQQGVLPRPPFKGSATRYDRVHLLWLCGIWRLRAMERLPLAKIRKRLEAMSSTELETFATEHLSRGPIADALGVSRAPAQVDSPPPALSGALAGSGALSQFPRWARIELALGIELHVRSDASPSAIDLARRIREYCSSSYGEELDVRAISAE